MYRKLSSAVLTRTAPTSTTTPLRKGRLTIHLTDAFRRAAQGAELNLETFELVRGRKRVPLVGQRAYAKEVGRPLCEGQVFWAAMALAYRPVDGVLTLHFDGARFDWGHEGGKTDEDQSALYERVKRRFDRRGPFKQYRAHWMALKRQFERLSADERRARGDASQLECAFATQGRALRDDKAVTRYLNAAELTYGWRSARVSVAALSRLNTVILGKRRGALRDFEAAITGKDELQYVPAALLPGAMEELARFIAGSRWTPVEVAASAYQRIVSLHPFADGNGRTGRVVMNGLLHRAHFPPAALRGNEQLVALYGTHARGRNFGVERSLKLVTQGMERAVRGRLIHSGHTELFA